MTAAMENAMGMFALTTHNAQQVAASIVFAKSAAHLTPTLPDA